MRVKYFILVLIISIMLISVISNVVNANSEIGIEKRGNITNYYAKQDPIRYAQSIVNMTDTEKKKLFEYTMQNHDKTIPITYIALADYVYKTNKNDALFWYFVGRIRSTEDLYMCTDESARQQVAYYPMLAENTMTYFAKQDRSEASKIMAKALAWDESHPARVNPKWACYHGMEIFTTGDVTIKPMSEYSNAINEYREYVRKSLK